ncbi:MAG: ABC transporter permease [Bifidobacteriaceae bacterium]|jgi:ABC-2 type transport system permease protein|nr:ABC transporter permease [Bifidobacteriaceae bacterium]
MTAVTYNTNRAVSVPARAVRPARPAYRLSFGGAVASEWVKLRSARSTWWNVVIQLVLGAGLAALTAVSVLNVARDSGDLGVRDGDFAGFGAAVANQEVAIVGTVIALALGVLAVTGEYSSGSIKSTLSADPRRGQVLAAKAVVLALVGLVLASVVEAIALVLVKVLFETGAVPFEMGAVGWKAAAGAVAFFIAVALIGVGLGFCLRSSAGAISLGLGLFFVLDILLNFAGKSEFVALIREITPGGAGQLVFGGSMAGVDQTTVGYWGAMACLAGWVALALVGGYLALRRRDA